MINKTFLVFDLELTCWETNEEERENQVEIIDFGYSFLNTETLTISGPHTILIKPQVSKISEFCTKLTGYTYTDVKRGIIWQDACKNMIKKRGFRKYPTIAWGKDYDDVKKQCELFKSDFPLGEYNYDWGNLYSMMFGDGRRVSLDQAMSENKVELNELYPRHKAGNDSLYTAKVVKKLLERMKR